MTMTTNAPEVCSMIDELQQANRALEADPASIDRQRDVCLASRSAYTDFYSHCVLTSEVDSELRTQLQAALEKARRLLPERSKYRESVNQRFDNFLEFCKTEQLRPGNITSISFDFELAGSR